MSKDRIVKSKELTLMGPVGWSEVVHQLKLNKPSVLKNTGIVNEISLSAASMLWSLEIKGYVIVDEHWHAAVRTKGLDSQTYILKPLYSYGSKVFIYFNKGDLDRVTLQDVVLFTLQPESIP